MRIDLPLCSFKDCRYNFDGNCKDKGRKEKCEFDVYKKAVEEQPKIGGWTPCSDRLPETDGFYQVTVKMTETGERFVEKKHYKSQNGWDSPLTKDFIEIVAWQPLPEAYHG